MDELYGDLDDKLSGTSLYQNEDSVDIYSGLENSPKGDEQKGKASPLLSPRTVESMDIYEDIIREEQEEKEATYNELKQKFDDAQKHVKELLSKLQLLETKNSSLSNENMLLKKNICSLIKTARMEIVRKDEEISRLSNRSGRGSHGQNFHRSQVERGPTRHILNNSTSSVLGSQSAREASAMADASPHMGRNTVLNSSTPLASSATAPRPFEVLQRCPRTELESPLLCQNKSAAKSNSNSLTFQPEQDQGPVKLNRLSGNIKNPSTSSVDDSLNTTKTSNSGLRDPFTTTDNRLKDLKDNNKQLDHFDKPQICTSQDNICNSKAKDVLLKFQRRVDCNSSKPGRTEMELGKDSSAFSENSYQQQSEVPVILKSSELMKSSSSQTHKASPCVSSQSKSSDKTIADVVTQSQGHKQNQNADRIGWERRHSGLSSTACSVVDEVSHSQNESHKKRVANGPDKREEKGSSAERRYSRTERSRDHEQKKQKESDRSKRDEGNNSSTSRERRSNRSNSSRDYERRSVKEAYNKNEDKRHKKQTDTLESRQAFSYSKCDSQRKDGKSSRISEPSSKSKRSHSHDKSKKMYDLKCPIKSTSSGNCSGDKDRERKRSGHLKEGESKDVYKDGRRNSPRKYKDVRKDREKEKDKHLSKTSEDKTPDRKLSFMETLNLTLSPLKKQKQPLDPKEVNGATFEDASPKGRFSDTAEEFFVVDELKNSQNSEEKLIDDPVGKQEKLTSSCKQSAEAFNLLTVVASEPSAEQTDMEVQGENTTEHQEVVDKVPATVSKENSKTSDSKMLDTDLSPRDSPKNTKDSMGITDNVVVSNGLSSKESESDCSPDLIVDVCQQQNPEEASQMENQRNPQAKFHDLLPAPNGNCQDVSSSDNEPSIPKIDSFENSESSVNTEVSSNMIRADFDDTSNAISDVEQVRKRNNERIGKTIQSLHPDNLKMSEKSEQNSSSGQNTRGPNASTTISKETMSSLQSSDVDQVNNLKWDNNSTEENSTSEKAKAIKTLHTDNLKMSEKFQSPSSGQNTRDPDDTSTISKETVSSLQSGFTESDSTEKEEQNKKSSNPALIFHDEDSMMLTLSNIRIIPEPISPLTSPVRQVRKVQPQHLEKQQHVKSLSNDLSAVTTSSGKDEVNMDMNKENKSPDTVTASSNKGTKDSILASGTEEDELEDGEIVSESEEEGPLFIQTPPKEKDKSTQKTSSIPKLPVVRKRVPPKKSCIPIKFSKCSKSSASNNSPTSSKRRFKTVSPPMKAAVYTLDGFMDTLRSIRTELRKKYMKLQKNVTKTAFCCIVDMSHASFTDFINSVDFDKVCCQGNDIKSRLNKIISTIMSKMTKNGIVNRIFDQKAGDLKQKLWTFVDGQFDFLFKELKTALKSGSEPPKNATLENKNATLERKAVQSEVADKDCFSTPGYLHIAKKSKVDTGSLVKNAHPNNLPHRGLGSRGKNIKAVMEEDNQSTKVTASHQVSTSSSEETSESEKRISSYVRRLSHNGSIQDKSDFEILTEQQTSSLTFNLVSDSQMGEIFKCLLQGSDLLESNGPIGDNTSWSLCTPRKEGESFIGIVTPNKTPSKFITSWSTISPYKFASTNKMLIDPAILDESCLLEVPSSSEACQLPLQSTVNSQRSFSILAEDLAVSLTIPSPLKSDSHLSFLHPGTGQPLSAPNSVLSAHYSEDALLDGEDATEQDIHLSLDTDNSSCGSSPSRTWESSGASGFQFQSNLPMQAEVMERSNDHFIVRIRRTSTSPYESKQTDGKAELQLTPCPGPSLEHDLTLAHEGMGHGPGEPSNKSPIKVNESCHISDKAIESQTTSQKSLPEGVCDGSSFNNVASASKEAYVTPVEESSAAVPDTSEMSGNIRNVIQNPSATESESKGKSKKRKRHQSEPKAKRPKVEKSRHRHSKSRHKKRSKSSKDKDSKPDIPQVSPSNLSAKNVIRKKGEVVVTWTRDEDRDILVELKMKGTSPKTFAALSKRLKKSTEQIEERFSQLMKLFKKKEKMEN